MEIWELLDKDGNETGKTIKNGEVIPEGFYHLGADVWIINSENKILIQKRSPKKKASPNVWAMTGGSVIKGETSLETIERETLEELGIKLNMKNIKLVKKFKSDKVWIHTYLIKQDINLSEIIMQEDEVIDVKWATYEEIENLVKNGNFMKNRWNHIKDLIKNQPY